MDPYKVLQVDPEAEDEVIQAAYRRLAQKYHPDVAGPDGSARMASINAAWELSARSGAAARQSIASGGSPGTRRKALGRPRRPTVRPARPPRRGRPSQPTRGGATPGPAERPPETVSRTGRAVAPRSAAATTRPDARGRRVRRRRTATGRSVRDRPQVRAVRRLVARRGRAARRRLHRVARPDADRAALPRRDRRDPPEDRPSPQRDDGHRSGAGSSAR